MKQTFLLALTALALGAQPITIAAASPTDQYFTGGIPGPSFTFPAWAVPLPAPLNFLRYTQPNDPKCLGCFKYDIPRTAGIYTVRITLVEPSKTAAGQRLFTIAINGQVSDPIDVYALAGGINKPVVLTFTAVVVGKLHLVFQAIAGNAIASLIQLTPASLGGPCAAPATGVTLYSQLPDGTCLPIVPVSGSGIAQIIQATSASTSLLGTPSQLIQVFFVQVTPTGAAPAPIRPELVIDWQSCSGGSLTTNCDGVEWFKILRPDGSLIYRYALNNAPAAPAATAQWSTVK